MRLVPDHRTPGPSNSSPSTTYKPITGHCYCGAIEWQLVGKVAFTANCHCKTCQCLAGSAYGSTSLMVYDDNGIEFTRGQPKVFHDTADSGNPTQRSVLIYLLTHLSIPASSCKFGRPPNTGLMPFLFFLGRQKKKI